MVKRKTEFLLGLTGGIMGIFFSFFSLLIDNLSRALKVESINGIVELNWVAITLSVIGILGCFIVTSKAKIGGSLMITAAIGGFICISLFYLLPGSLLLVGGLMGISRKEKPKLTVL